MLITRWQVSTYLFKVFGLLHEVLSRFRILQNLWRNFETHRRQQFHFAHKMNESWVVVDSHQFVAVERDHRRIIGQAGEVVANESRELDLTVWRRFFYLREWSRIPAMMFLLHMSKISLVRSLTSFSKACASLIKACDSSLSLRKVWTPFNIFITCPASVNEWLVCKWRTNEMCYLSFKLSRCINFL